MTRRRGGSQKSYGAALRERRLAAGLTQRELAEAGGTSVAAIRDLEQGRTHRPRPVLAGRLVRALRLDAGQAAHLLRAGQDPAPAWPASGDAQAARLRLRILGPLAAWRDGVPLCLGGPRQRAVLGLLATCPGDGLHRDTVIDALWGEEPPATAVSLVQAYVSRLRRVLDPGQSPRDPRGVLVSAYARYALHATASQLDLLAFGELAGRACAVRSAGDPATACQLYERALGLWRAEPLADIELLRDHPAVVALAGARAEVIASYADTAFGTGQPERVVPHLRELTWREPLDEKAHALLMIALAATGQQAAALRVYERLRERLDRQLGVRPGRELTQAHLRVLRQDVPSAGNAGPHRPRAPVRCRAACGPLASATRHTRDTAGPPRQLPAATAPLVGRAAELRHLSRLLDEGGPAMILTISGTAGVGKTSLALHWARQVAARFPDGQLHVNLRGHDPSGPPLPPGRVIRGFLDALGVPAASMPASPGSRADLYRGLLAGRRMLVALDDAREEAQVRPLLPGAPGCLVMITSRSRLTGLVAAEGARPLTLDLMTEADARELLARRLDRQRAEREPEPLTELIRLCARLPLALSLAAAIAATRPDLPLAVLAAELRDTKRRLDTLETGDVDTSLRAAFHSSYLSLSDPAARMFRLLGVHPEPDVSLQGAARLAGVPPAQARDALRELTRGHLLGEPAPGRFACHDLLRAYAAERTEAREGEVGWRAAPRRLTGYRAHAAPLAGILG